MSLDLGPACLESVTAEGHAPQVTARADIFHVVNLIGDALSEVRRDLWRQLQRGPYDCYSKGFKGARWALLENPEDLTDRQVDQLARTKRNKGGVWRANEMKEQFRVILTCDLTRT